MSKMARVGSSLQLLHWDFFGGAILSPAVTMEITGQLFKKKMPIQESSNRSNSHYYSVKNTKKWAQLLPKLLFANSLPETEAKERRGKKPYFYCLYHYREWGNFGQQILALLARKNTKPEHLFGQKGK